MLDEQEELAAVEETEKTVLVEKLALPHGVGADYHAYFPVLLEGAEFGGSGTSSFSGPSSCAMNIHSYAYIPVCVYENLFLGVCI